jgi:hypothetical protein
MTNWHAILIILFFFFKKKKGRRKEKKKEKVLTAYGIIWRVEPRVVSVSKCNTKAIGD